MIVNRGWATSLALAERWGLGAFVILHGVQHYRRDRRERSLSGAGAATIGWGLEHQSDYGATAEASAPGRCCACKRGRACPDPGKHPRVIKDVQEHGCLDARGADELMAIICELRPRPINLGIVPADNLLVVDIDPRNGGVETLRKLEAKHGPLPPTLSVYTGGGGEHRWYRTPQAVPRRAALGPGVDLKSHGGLLVAPPSVHLSGRRYQWINSRLPPADVPTWLDQTSTPSQTSSGGAGSSGQPSKAADGVIARTMATAQVGERSLTLFRLACWALDTDDDLIALRLAARSTGMTERKIEAQIRSARARVRR